VHSILEENALKFFNFDDAIGGHRDHVNRGKELKLEVNQTKSGAGPTEQSGVPTASGQKTTLSQCGIGLSQREKAFTMEFPFEVIGRVVAGRVANSSAPRGERVGFLLSEVDLPRFGMLDPRVIRSLARLKPPIMSIIRTSRSLKCVRHILLQFSGGKTPPLARYAVDYFAVETSL
jgi:hypothetical protein